jgi:hypothetical protein
MRTHLSLISGVIFVAVGLACDPTPPPDPPTPDRIDVAVIHKPIGVCGHHTETQSSWGAPCDDDDGPGCYRDAHFAEVFPEGLYVGCGELTANLLSSAAVEVALPSLGKPRALYKDEAGAYDGVDDPVVGTALFGQVVALSLNVGFSELPSFDKNGAAEPFGELVIADPGSPCAGMTVQQVLDEANVALGDCDAVLTPGDAYGCVKAINKSFTGGAKDEDCSAEVAIADPPM